jgi:hypothetical protein
MVQAFSDYVAPRPDSPVQTVVSLTSDHGHIDLVPNRFGYGYKLRDNVQGLGAGTVNNELTPREGHRGAMLGVQHAEAGEMSLPIMINSTSPAEVERLIDRLVTVVNLSEGTVRITRTNPVTGQARFRDAAYKSGLDTPRWSSPYAAEFNLTFDYPDPFAYAPPKTVTLLPTAAEFQGGWVAPFVFPLVADGTSVPSAASVTNEGTKPAPMQVTFHGPSTNPRAWAGPISVEYRGNLAHDEHVTINGKDHTVLLHGGGRTQPVPVPGRLSPHTLLTDLVVPVGRTDWWYQAIDESLQSKAVFTWWDAYQSIK